MEASKDASFYLRRKCWRKKGYSTSRYANRQIKHVYKQYHLQLYKYKCESCGEWHLTKQLAAKGKVL